MKKNEDSRQTTNTILCVLLLFLSSGLCLFLICVCPRSLRGGPVCTPVTTTHIHRTQFCRTPVSSSSCSRSRKAGAQPVCHPTAARHPHHAGAAGLVPRFQLAQQRFTLQAAALLAAQRSAVQHGTPALTQSRAFGQ